MVIAFLPVFVAAARGQSPARATSSVGLAFEAASIQQNKSAETRRNFGMEPGGRFVMVNDSIGQIVGMAYAETPEIRGLPDWVTRERYDIKATAGRDTSRDEMVAMLRKLLSDRLHFRAHVENTKQEAYALTPASPRKTLGPRMQKSPVDCAALTAALAVNDAAPAES